MRKPTRRRWRTSRPAFCNVVSWDLFGSPFLPRIVTGYVEHRNYRFDHFIGSLDERVDNLGVGRRVAAPFWADGRAGSILTTALDVPQRITAKSQSPKGTHWASYTGVMTVGIRAVAHRQVLNTMARDARVDAGARRRSSGRGAAPRGDPVDLTSAATPQPKSRSRDIPFRLVREPVHPDLAGQGASQDRQSTWGSDVVFALSTASFACQAVEPARGLSSPTAVQRRQRRQLCLH